MSSTHDGPDPEFSGSEDDPLLNEPALPPEPEVLAGEDEFNEDDFDDDFDDDFEDELDEDLQEFENELEGIKPPDDGDDDGVEEEFEEEDF
jgi:hypothetical protein